MEGRGTPSWLVWAATALGLVSLGLVVLDAVLASDIRSLQGEVNRRGQQINQAAFLNRVEGLIQQALANEAVAYRDEDIRAMLARHGVTISNWPSAPAAAPAAAAPAPVRAPVAGSRQGGVR